MNGMNYIIRQRLIMNMK